MQKLIVKRQFLGVQPCEIEFDRFLLLIGEQASGKSTIAKLIFFFQTLPDVIYDMSVKAHSKSDLLDYKDSIYTTIQSKFLETFGFASQNESFDIEFNYKKNVRIKIFQGGNTQLYVIFESNNLHDTVIKSVKDYIESKRLDIKVDEFTFRQKLKNELDLVFDRKNNENTYLIAGRNTIVAFPEIFEKIVGKEIEKLIEDEIKEQDFEKRQRLGNEMLLYKFVEWSRGIRSYFKNNGQTFEKASKNLINHNALAEIEQIAHKILKGKYQSAESGEQIQIEGSRLNIPLKDASSGQQESLRILQGLFLATGLNNRKEFFVIEEPEAHLYPLAQKELINAFAVFLNTIEHGKLIVTTHSPYILACINILLYADYVSKEIGTQNGKINNISRAFWLDSSFFNAYSLGQSEAYCVNIKDDVTGLIDQNYLDAISEQLGLQYQELYNLLIKETI
jgi:predicted ATP-dependent endonuclease of OLD family